MVTGVEWWQEKDNNNLIRGNDLAPNLVGGRSIQARNVSRTAKICSRHGSRQIWSVYSPGGCLQFAQVSALGQSRISIEMSRHVRFRSLSAYTELPICDFRETGATARRRRARNQPAPTIAPAGNEIWKTDPRGRAERAERYPLWASTMDRQIDRPIPMPCDFVVKNG